MSHPRAGGGPIALLLFVTTLAFAEPPLPPEKLAARLEAAITPLFQPDQPGGTVILARDGKTIFRKAFGLASLERDAPLAPEMAFRIGSITKHFTAVGIFLLVDEGKVALDDDITKHLPDYPARGRRITIHHLPGRQQQAIASAFEVFAAAAGEVPEHLWPPAPDADVPPAASRPDLARARAGASMEKEGND